jgi:16S rRNA (adenine1518-N6/adenine1519-N6)-dimethyltransferase
MTGHRHRPRKRFGQHFLEPAWVRKLVDAIAPDPGDVFLEIGPGRGALTRPLAERARLVVGVEVDRDLADALTRAALPNVRVVEGDVLQADLPALVPPDEADRLRVAGNLPYNISSPILFRLLEWRRGDPRLTDATVMLQREVVDRLVARPGNRDYGILSVLFAREAQVTRVLTLPPGAFRPPPQVTSAVVRLAFRPDADVPEAPPLFESLVRAVFAQRRKTLGNALRAFATSRATDAVAAIRRAGLSPAQRPETLDLAAFLALARAVTGDQGDHADQGEHRRGDRGGQGGV